MRLLLLLLALVVMETGNKQAYKQHMIICR
jgi:hypothetical protein